MCPNSTMTFCTYLHIHSAHPLSLFQSPYHQWKKSMERFQPSRKNCLVHHDQKFKAIRCWLPGFKVVNDIKSLVCNGKISNDHSNYQHLIFKHHFEATVSQAVSGHRIKDNQVVILWLFRKIRFVYCLLRWIVSQYVSVYFSEFSSNSQTYHK